MLTKEINQRQTARIQLVVPPELKTRMEQAVQEANFSSVNQMIRTAIEELLDRLSEEQIKQRLIEGYQANAEFLQKMNEEWEHVSDEV
ncbi:MAG TPA: hypothetical protein PL107_10355 [Candidatus Marinimicrobia bacterium]|jgi:Arc/MetJ-type ribon-helix-helix transcriptional regulator|nr:hypothetical protein [Candidatus Neomarinimicrobiota bacterium]HOV24646.1 hypothetical protein [Candidatus Neomarinimicrobiota bacterium]